MLLLKIPFQEFYLKKMVCVSAILIDIGTLLSRAFFCISLLANDKHF